MDKYKSKKSKEAVNDRSNKSSAMEKNHNSKTEVGSKPTEFVKPELMVYLQLYDEKSKSAGKVGCHKHQASPCVECIDG